MPIYNIRPTTEFRDDFKRLKKCGFDISLLTDIIKAGCEGAVAGNEQGSPTFRGLCGVSRVPHYARLVANLRNGQRRAGFISCPDGITERFILEDPPGF